MESLCVGMNSSPPTNQIKIYTGDFGIINNKQCQLIIEKLINHNYVLNMYNFKDVSVHFNTKTKTYPVIF